MEVLILEVVERVKQLEVLLERLPMEIRLIQLLGQLLMEEQEES
jgi:hypothetical protein